MIERFFYISAVKSDGSEVQITFEKAKSTITENWLQNTFLPAASPVLGIIEITAASYELIERTDLI